MWTDRASESQNWCVLQCFLTAGGYLSRFLVKQLWHSNVQCKTLVVTYVSMLNQNLKSLLYSVITSAKEIHFVLLCLEKSKRNLCFWPKWLVINYITEIISQLIPMYKTKIRIAFNPIASCQTFQTHKSRLQLGWNFFLSFSLNGTGRGKGSPQRG